MRFHRIFILFHRASKVAWIVSALSLAPAISRGQVPGMTLDQQNDHYGYYTYNTHGGWQSFTAGTNGHLGAVQLWLYSTGSNSGNSGGGDWTAILRIYEGEGTGGRILAEQAISGDGLLQRRTFVIETPVRQAAGSQYTVSFGGSATHLTVRLSGNQYAGGTCSTGSAYDYNFMTYVITSDWSEEAYRDTSFTAVDMVISNAAQLAQFAWLVNNGNLYSGSTVTLANDISLAGHYWTPISFNSTWEKNFSGIFDGNGKTIRCVIVDHPGMAHQGVFGYSTGSIRNTNVTDVDIRGSDLVGGLISYCGGSVSNCSVSGLVAGNGYVGGVAGYGQVLACVNRSSVTGANHVGGVVGAGALAPLSGCRNEGSVTGSGYKIGGVAGQVEVKVQDCSNSGPVTGGPLAEQIGGVIGNSLYGGEPILGCTNSGDVVGGETVGGIGGWIGVELVRCVNTGSVTGDAIVGGLAGQLYECTARDCENRGAVAATSKAGGLAGYHAGFSINSVNTGTVAGDEYVGGLTGISENWARWSNCLNSGPVIGTSSVGALAGQSYGVFSNCYWKQTGVAPFDLPAGGGTLTLRDCRFFGDAPGTLAAPVTVGGVTTDRLASALNAWVAAAWTPGCGFSSWTAGTEATYPTLAPATEVGGSVTPQTLSDRFMGGVTAAQIEAAVAAYTNAQPATTASSFGSLLTEADAMGFTYAELATGGTLLAFAPGITITDLARAPQSLTFTVANGIDTTAIAAMNRLAASTTAGWHVLQADTPGGAESPLAPTVAFHGDGTADAVFTPAGSPTNAFFRLRLEHRP